MKFVLNERITHLGAIYRTLRAVLIVTLSQGIPVMGLADSDRNASHNEAMKSLFESSPNAKVATSEPLPETRKGFPPEEDVRIADSINGSEADALYVDAHEWLRDSDQYKKYGGFSLDAQLARSKHSAEELRDFGVDYLKEAKTPIQFEKAVWFLLAARAKDQSVETVDDSILGRAAAIAAETYADPESELHDYARAFKLHYRAGFLGVQSSLLAAGYLQRFSDKTKLLAHYHPADLISNEAMLFRNASYCSDEKLARKSLPFSQELCDIAFREMTDAERRVQEAYHTPSGSDAAIWAAVVMLGLVALAADSGAPAADVSSVKPINYMQGLAADMAEIEFSK